MIFPIVLPELQITPVFEYRIRLERRNDPDFSETTADSRSVLEQRFRPGFDLTDGKRLSGEFRFNYAHELTWAEAGNRSHESRDLFLGHLDYKLDGSTLSLGRQTISKGDRRLVDVSNFSQRPKAFDVVRVRNAKFDVFAGKIGLTSNEQDHSKVAGLWFETNLGESLVFWKRDDSDVDVSHITFDQRKVLRFGATTVAVEGAVQTGKAGGADHEAFWVHARATHPLNKQVRLFAEGNIASGGEEHRFDPLYGTGHAPYGLMDLQGLRNMRHLEIGVSGKISPRLNGLASWNKYGLYDPEDGWYGTGGNLNRRPGGRMIDQTGNSGTDVGQEFNLAFDYSLNARQTVSLELGLFQPGGFVRNLVGPSADDQTWGLLTFNTRF